MRRPASPRHTTPPHATPGLAVSILLLPLLLAGCSGSSQATRRARDLFRTHQDTFLALATLVGHCTGAGYLSIFPDGTVPDPAIPAHGDTVHCPDVAAIASAARTLHALRINVEDEPPFGDGGLGASIVLASRGTSNSDHGEAIYWFPQAETKPFDDGAALAPVPGHWFYKWFGS